MKNTVFILALVVALIAVFAAPAHSDGIILRGGVNFAKANTDLIDDEDQEFRPGVNAALLSEIGSGPARLLAGVGYENRGTRVHIGDDNGDMKLNYVTIPVMLSLGTVSNGNGIPRIFVNVGGEAAFLVQDEASLDDFTLTFDDTWENFDFGLRAEAGLEIPLSVNAGLVAGGAYSQSLTDALTDDDFEWKNYTWHIFGGVKVGMF